GALASRASRGARAQPRPDLHLSTPSSCTSGAGHSAPGARQLRRAATAGQDQGKPRIGNPAHPSAVATAASCSLSERAWAAFCFHAGIGLPFRSVAGAIYGIAASSSAFRGPRRPAPPRRP
ncbi:unnamed protein product, partial [Prorocentrum cordatum]